MFFLSTTPLPVIAECGMEFAIFLSKLTVKCFLKHKNEKYHQIILKIVSLRHCVYEYVNIIYSMWNFESILEENSV